MKKRILLSFLCAVFLVSAGAAVSAASVNDFLGVVNFSMTLRDLSLLVTRGNQDQADTDRFIIVDGSVTSREVLSGEGETFVGEIEVIQGEWIGLEDVRMYRCIVRFTGDEFASLIPARRSRRRSETELTLHSRVLVVGRLAEFRTMADGSVIPVIEGKFIRLLI